MSIRIGRNRRYLGGRDENISREPEFEVSTYKSLVWGDSGCRRLREEIFMIK